MGVKVATITLQWSQLIVPRFPSNSQTFASALSSPFSRQRSQNNDGALSCCYVDRSVLFGDQLTSLLHRSRFCEISRFKTLKRACGANLDSFSEEEFSKKIQELALRFQLSDDGLSNKTEIMDSESEDINGLQSLMEESLINSNERQFPPLKLDLDEPRWLGIRQEPPDWMARDEITPAIERKANSVDLPSSLRIIKRKMKWQVGLRKAGESAYCSVKKAFSSMVFIIQELHSYTIQMREILCYEDLQGILIRVQKEMHASFVWLFQHVFSHTPTLMVYVMILLANFTVHSMAINTAIAASQPLTSHSVATKIISVHELQEKRNQNFDSSAIKPFSVFSSGKTTSIGGNNGGGRKVPRISSGMDGDGGLDGTEHYQTIIPDGSSQLSSLGTTTETELVSVSIEENVRLWNSIVEEASEMQSLLRDEALDYETMQKFVSPVNAEIEADDYADFFRTELLYQTALSRDPNHPLLLANYAQFLYLVTHNYHRAEELFKRATEVEPKDAEAFNKYASFLWRVKNDLWAAEETYLEAISADPSNSYYAANYAHFLWNTGGDDTCFPLNFPESS